MLIASFDPGVLTGTCAWDTEKKEVVFADQLTESELWDWVDERCGELDHSQIEQFVITAGTGKKSRQPEPLFVIGFLRYKAKDCGFSVDYSKPADVMRQFPDAALRQAGFYVTGKGHANDAMRHLCYRLVRTGEVEARRFLLGD